MENTNVVTMEKVLDFATCQQLYVFKEENKEFKTFKNQILESILKEIIMEISFPYVLRTKVQRIVNKHIESLNNDNEIKEKEKIKKSFIELSHKFLAHFKSSVSTIVGKNIKEKVNVGESQVEIIIDFIYKDKNNGEDYIVVLNTNEWESKEVYNIKEALFEKFSQDFALSNYDAASPLFLSVKGNDFDVTSSKNKEKHEYSLKQVAHIINKMHTKKEITKTENESVCKNCLFYWHCKSEVKESQKPTIVKAKSNLDEIELNTEQINALTSEARVLYLEGAKGSGKTRVMISRFLDEVLEGNNPIWITTQSEAVSIKEKVTAVIKSMEEVYGNLNIATEDLAILSIEKESKIKEIVFKNSMLIYLKKLYEYIETENIVLIKNHFNQQEIKYRQMETLQHLKFLTATIDKDSPLSKLYLSRKNIGSIKELKDSGILPFLSKKIENIQAEKEDLNHNFYLSHRNKSIFFDNVENYNQETYLFFEEYLSANFLSKNIVFSMDIQTVSQKENMKKLAQLLPSLDEFSFYKNYELNEARSAKMNDYYKKKNLNKKVETVENKNTKTLVKQNFPLSLEAILVAEEENQIKPEDIIFYGSEDKLLKVERLMKKLNKKSKKEVINFKETLIYKVIQLFEKVTNQENHITSLNMNSKEWKMFLDYYNLACEDADINDFEKVKDLTIQAMQKIEEKEEYSDNKVIKEIITILQDNIKDFKTLKSFYQEVLFLNSSIFNYKLEKYEGFYNLSSSLRDTKGYNYDVSVFCYEDQISETEIFELIENNTNKTMYLLKV